MMMKIFKNVYYKKVLHTFESTKKAKVDKEGEG